MKQNLLFIFFVLSWHIDEQNPNEYVFRDEQIESGENYYRLKLTGTDHSVDYSDIVRVLVPDTTNALAFYRASSREIIIHPEVIPDKEALSLYTIHGNLVKQVPGGSKSIAAGHLAGGIYILVVNTGKGRVLQKLMVY